MSDLTDKIKAEADQQWTDLLFVRDRFPFYHWTDYLRGAEGHLYCTASDFPAEDNSVARCTRCQLVVKVSPLTGLCRFCEQALKKIDPASPPSRECIRCGSTIEVSPLTNLCWSCEQALREDEDDDSAEPDFPAEDNDVTTQYVDGTLQVTLSRELDKRQVKAFCYGATQRRGVRSCELDGAAGYERGYTPFSLTFNPKYARLLEEVRADVAAYAREFLAGLVETPVQADLFSLDPVQSSMF